jgi:hypothetical protein
MTFLTSSEQSDLETDATVRTPLTYLLHGLRPQANYTDHISIIHGLPFFVVYISFLGKYDGVSYNFEVIYPVYSTLLKAGTAQSV